MAIDTFSLEPADRAWLEPIIHFYEVEFLNYLPEMEKPGTNAVSKAKNAELYAWQWVGRGASAVPMNPPASEILTPIQAAVKEFLSQEEAVRRRLCVQLLERVFSPGMAGVPRKWWEEHPDHQAAWNSWFPCWPNGILTLAALPCVASNYERPRVR